MDNIIDNGAYSLAIPTLAIVITYFTCDYIYDSFRFHVFGIYIVVIEINITVKVKGQLGLFDTNF